MIAEVTPLSHHIAVWLAGLLEVDASWPFHAVGMLVVAVIILAGVITPVGLGSVYLERYLAT